VEVGRVAVLRAAREPSIGEEKSMRGLGRRKCAGIGDGEPAARVFIVG
jgi:hypothetical protein